MWCVFDAVIRHLMEMWSEMWSCGRASSCEPTVALPESVLQGTASLFCCWVANLTVRIVPGTDNLWPVVNLTRKRGDNMARKTNLKKAAIKIGTAVGKADRAAHQVGRVGLVAKEEILALIDQVDDLKRQLEKAAKRLKSALR